MNHRNHGRGFDGMIRAIGPFVAMAAMGGLMAARNNANTAKFTDKFEDKFSRKFAPGPGKGGRFRFNGREGVPLEQLDIAVDAPAAVVLASGDHVVIESGADFAIALQGDDAAKARVRFALEDGALFIMRDADGDESGSATVTITMPAPNKLTIAGSGQITAVALADEAEVVIAGSGRIVARAIDVQQLDLSIAGSGQFEAAGTADRLNLSVAGSGNADMAELLVETGKVSIAGSGHVVFASDGKVKAHLMGSGIVTVRGAARCKVQSVGSGCLVCEPRDKARKNKAS
jgi:Putative auto-transporter adhesin, head GIN domain